MSTTSLRHTVDEYFEVEFASDERHEYVDGEIIQMVGGSRPHNKIQMNLLRILFATFMEPYFEVFGESTRLKIGDPLSYLFADACLVTGTAQFEELRRDTLLNPAAVFEILSPSTELYNRGRKFELYKRINSLQFYVLISQHEMAVECFSRQPDGQWIGKQFAGRDAVILFESLNWTLTLNQLYQNVQFVI